MLARLSLWSLTLAFAATFSEAADCTGFPGQYGYTETTLSTAANYKSYHKVVGDTLHLILSADTANWIGFGIGEPTSGHMKGGDFVTVRFDNGNAVAEDRHANFAAWDPVSRSYNGLTAVADTHNDWTVVEAAVESGRQLVHLTRLLETADTQDRNITAGPQNVLWAYGSGTSVAYHGSNRGVTSITFIAQSNPPTPTEMPSADGTLDFNFGGYVIPHSTHTTYACQAFNVTGTQDRHVVAFSPRIHTAAAAHVHHIVVHACRDSDFLRHHKTPRLCDDTTFGDRRQSCYSIMYSWAVGMGDFILPLEAGFKIGPNGAQSLLIEIHYDNPTNPPAQGVVDRSGVRFHYVNTLRANDAGMLWVGDPTVTMGNQATSAPYQLGELPAQNGEVVRQATCPGSCTSRFSAPITVFASFLHQHYFGKTIVSSQYDSSGNKIRTLNRIDFWDNGFQRMTPIGPYTINPGDSIQSLCTFDTRGVASSAGNVRFGGGTADEMCMEFIMYYPVQHRGTTSDGTPAPLEMCGMRSDSGALSTVCGASFATYPSGQSWSYSGGQVDRSGMELAPPFDFGTANLGTRAAPTLASCTANLATANFNFASSTPPTTAPSPQTTSQNMNDNGGTRHPLFFCGWAALAAVLSLAAAAI